MEPGVKNPRFNIVIILTLLAVAFMISGCYVRTKRAIQARMDSYPNYSQTLMLEMGPILGQTGETFFTITCKTEEHVSLVLETDNRKFISSHKEFHHFLVSDLSPGGTYEVILRQIDNDGKGEMQVGPFQVKTFPESPNFDFVVWGDNRTGPEAWARVAAAIHKSSPRFMVSLGDYAKNGIDEGEWREQFWRPAKDLLMAIPSFAIRGNHENNSEVYPEVFYVPGDEPNWVHQFGEALFIGVDGDLDWSKGSRNIKWLEDVLATADAKFIFFFSHYPAWSSSNHADTYFGEPSDREVREAQNVIAPLLSKYKVTAMLVGHCHFYERSELPGGLTHIISGGAGSPFSEIDNDADEQNPYSTKLVIQHHFLKFTVSGNTCTMHALTPEGKIIDTKTWAARQ